LLRQRIAEYSCVPIVMIGMVGLALDIGTREWKNDGTIVAETFVERSPLTMETKAEPEPSMQLSAPVVAEPFVERWPPTLKTQAEPEPSMQLSACRALAAYTENPGRAKAYHTAGGTGPGYPIAG
jgi:hypothetical protein